MQATIAMTYRFRNLFANKDDEAKDLERKIKEHLNIAQQKLGHAKADYEASLKRGGGMDGLELAHREQALEKYKALYQKAQNYAESAKKIYQNVHGEFERVEFMTNRQRNKLENSKEEGNNFLNKAISALNEYRQ
jgi:hypothetical protein